MVGWTVRRGFVLGVGAVWWWAVVRLALGGGGVVEGAIATGGWGLSLLPVHCVPKRQAAAGVEGGRGVAVRRVGHLTRASRRRRSDAGSGPS